MPQTHRLRLMRYARCFISAQATKPSMSEGMSVSGAGSKGRVRLDLAGLALLAVDEKGAD